ncbi:hypothetical protein GA0115243_1044109 [Streptomyces sp. ScaeMP-e83]|nr:hypothetical protein GA0115243_1044109 [Streptomyces sp. ScaeMP-e83]
MTTSPPSWPLVLQIRGEARRRPDHHGPVHPHGPGPQLAAQPGGAELERARETGGELLGVARLDEGAQLVARLGVGVLGQPGPGLRDEVVLHGVRLFGVCGGGVRGWVRGRVSVRGRASAWGRVGRGGVGAARAVPLPAPSRNRGSARTPVLKRRTGWEVAPVLERRTGWGWPRSSNAGRAGGGPGPRTPDGLGRGPSGLRCGPAPGPAGRPSAWPSRGPPGGLPRGSGARRRGPPPNW